MVLETDINNNSFRGTMMIIAIQLEPMTDVYIDTTVKALQQLHQATLRTDKRTIRIAEFLDLQAKSIIEAHKNGNEAVCFHLCCWCKPLIGKSKEEVMNGELTVAMAQQTMASEHGYKDWATVQQQGDEVFDLTFENCIDTMLTGDLDKFTSALTTTPALAQQQSQYGHRATLLHYLGANGVESYRQVTPLNAVKIAECLIEAGANVNATANIYGGSKPLGLLTTSAHPANAGVTANVAAVLEKAGAT